jgi:hypothetical protein
MTCIHQLISLKDDWVCCKICPKRYKCSNCWEDIRIYETNKNCRFEKIVISYKCQVCHQMRLKTICGNCKNENCYGGIKCMNLI